MRRALPVLFVVCAALAAPSTAQASSTRYVDDDRVQCPDAGWTVIQDAIDASGPGHRVVVCAGVYRGALRIADGKDGLRLSALGRHEAVLAGSGPEALDRLITVQRAHDVAIQRFTILGTPEAPVDTGIVVGDFDTGSAVIRGNRIEGMRRDGISVIEGAARIFGNAILDVASEDPFGAAVRNREGYVNVAGNVIRPGAGAPRGMGVELANAGAADVLGNRIGDALNGVRLTGTFTEPRAYVRGNVITDSQVGILIGGFIGHGWSDGTWSPGEPRDGVVANRVTGNVEGIQLTGATGIAHTLGAKVRRNVVRDNLFGIRVVADLGLPVVGGSFIGGNDARSNRLQDCLEGESQGTEQPGTPFDAPQNTWYRNRGTLNVGPPGICR